MAEGQFNGPRDRYVYVSDTGDNIILVLDKSNAELPGTGLVLFDPATPPAGGGSYKAPNFEPRGVYWEGTLDGVKKRKFIVCGTTDAALYDSDVRQPLTIGAAVGVTTGRKGEQFTF